MHLRHLTELPRHPHRLTDAFGQIIVEADVVHRFIRVLPAGDEYRKPLIGQVLDQTFTGIQVQDVELVDPRRDDDDRHRLHFFRRRRVVDQLQHAITEHHLARRRRQILADGECVRRHHLNILGLGITLKIHPTLAQALATAGYRTLDGRGIEPEEIGRRHRIEPFAQPERSPALLLLRQPRRLEGHILQAVGESEIPLLDDVPGRRIGPGRIGETGIIRMRRDHIGRRQAERPPRNVRLQGEQITAQTIYGTRQLHRMHPPGQLGAHGRRHDAKGIKRIAHRT